MQSLTIDILHGNKNVPRIVLADFMNSYDILLGVNFTSLQTLYDFVKDKVSAIDGVLNIETFISADSRYYGAVMISPLMIEKQLQATSTKAWFTPHFTWGDIALLATHTLSTEELQKIHQNQSLIERQLGNPTLTELASDEMVSSLAE